MIRRRRQAKSQGVESLQTAKDRPFARDTRSSSKVGVNFSRSQNATPLQSASLRDLSACANVSKHAERSRRLGTVTSHACAACRKKRAKCDGETPCERCKLRGAECIYNATVSQSKAQLRAEVYTLRQRQHTLEQLIASVARPEYLPDALAHIPSGSVVDCSVELPSSTADMIDSGVESSVNSTRGKSGDPIAPNPKADDRTLDTDQCPSMQDATGATEPQRAASGSQSQSSRSTWSLDAHIHGWPGKTQEKSQGLLLDEPVAVSLSETWTRLTDDIELIRHLLALYFCWEYPNFAPISKEDFLQDFQEGRRRYCSPMLVNALLALGFYLSDRPLTALVDSTISGDIFFEEARRLFLLASHQHSITTIQALVIMSVRESRCSRLLESKYYAELAIRLAVEMGLHVVPVEGRGNKSAVLAKTFWGAFTINQAWSLLMGTLPLCSYSLQLPPKPAIIIDVETSSWVPYVDGDANLQPSVQQSNVRSVYQSFCIFNEIVHQSLCVLSAPDASLTTAKVLQIYRRYLHWYDQLPEGMRLGHNSTPAMLFTHLYYHFALLLHFRPFLRLRFIGTQINPQEVCTQAADAIQSLVTSYAKLYTLRRTPTFVPYFTFASATTRLAIDFISTRCDPSDSSASKPSIVSPEVCDALKPDIAHLAEMAAYHSFAKQALYILRCHAHERKSHEDDSVKPHDNGPNFSAPHNISERTIPNAAVESTIDAEGTGTPTCDVELLLPALFQFREKPFGARESELERAGFALL